MALEVSQPILSDTWQIGIKNDPIYFIKSVFCVCDVLFTLAGTSSAV